MWGTIFENEMSAIISGFGVMNGAALGAGHMLSRKTANPILKLIIKCSPTAYGLELNLRKIMSKNTAKDFILGYFHLTLGEQHCMDFLFY